MSHGSFFGGKPADILLHSEAFLQQKKKKKFIYVYIAQL